MTHAMKVQFVLLLFLGLFGLSCQLDDVPLVRTSLGSIRGTLRLSENGRKYEAYLGIPYAKTPTGKLRFKPPKPVSSWEGELPATKFASQCMQYAHIVQKGEDRVQGSEDCLYVNIYVPRTNKGEKNRALLPVIFWIHGGAFQFGDGSGGPEYLMDRDIVLVTVNYRLGPFGFLSTGDEVVPGNMGLMDQNMALRFVSKNIKYFGGDPQRVTLVGLSAGGASVHYHYLSHLSAGLFQGGISASGTALDCWTQTENAPEKAKKLGALMGCPTKSTRKMVECLRDRPPRLISQAVADFMGWLYNPFTPFGPVVEKHGDSRFLTRSPLQIINSGNVLDVPWVTGVVSEEGLYPAGEFVANDKLLAELDENWERYAPYLLDYNYTIPLRDHAKVARKIRQQYLGSQTIASNTVHPLVKMVGDRLFVVDSEKAARAQARVNTKPVWYYYYTYRGVHSLSEIMTGTTKNFGVSHSDDTNLVIGKGFEPQIDPKDKPMQKLLMDLWVSFATEGVPKVAGVNWLKVQPNADKLHFLSLAGPKNVSMRSDGNFGRRQFWSSIDFDENKLK